MKKIIFILVLTALTAFTTMAQGNNLAVNNEEPVAHESKKSFSKRVLAQLKAEEDFLKWNKHAENIRWYDNLNGFFVYYTKDGKNGRSFYNKKGNFVYNSISYTEQFLPFKVRKLIKSVYYMDYRITHVNEIRQDEKTAFVVTITDDKTWKKLKIMDDEMEEIKEYQAK